MDKDQPAAAQVPRSDTGSAQSSSMMESHAPVLSAAQIDALEALLKTVTPLTWADHAGKIWNVAPALLASARREARLEALLRESLVRLNKHWSDETERLCEDIAKELKHES